ncbi:MAG TPA: Rrf2 family transcriptional regulator [Solirubrobacteraceae bacterium]|nr:Rrf2 family transcriptional regulator [Solirubrobacteraceae bacterium]
MRVSAKVDYAVRASIELAAAYERDEAHKPVKAEALARAQDIPLKFLENILQGLRQADIVESRRGPDGGHLLARAASEISIADVIRAIDGPLAGVGGKRPDELSFSGSAAPMQEVWIAVRSTLRNLLEEVTLADVAAGALPDQVATLTADPDAWAKR